MDLNVWWAPALAFAAGVVSFASPCVLPLVPGYVGFVLGQGPDGRPASPSGDGAVAVAERPATRAALPMLLFVAGFALVFTLLGAFSRVFAEIFRHPWGQRIAGGIVVLFGVYLILYSLRIGGPRLFAERRPFLSKVRPGTAGAFPLGMAFATGFTPCIGPVLAGILTIAAAQGGGAWGALLMFTYSLGLGLPFVLVGLGLRRLMGALAWVKRNYHWIAGIGGVLMVVIGVLLMLNLWTRFLAWSGLLDLVSGFEPPI
ncbi:MAG TPA: cytochrome c biogenesis protein CcdA [Actinomycetota bacterium]